MNDIRRYSDDELKSRAELALAEKKALDAWVECLIAERMRRVEIKNIEADRAIREKAL